MFKFKLVLFTFLIFLAWTGLANGAGDLTLDNGSSYDQNVGTIPFTDNHDEGYTSAKHHSLFNVDTNEFLCNADGTSGDLIGDCGSWTASTTGAYSFVLTYDGDTAQCRIGSGGYTGCVSATFVDEFLFDIVEGGSSSTPTSTTTTSTPMEGYIAVLITVLFFCFGFWLSYNYMK